MNEPTAAVSVYIIRRDDLGRPVKVERLRYYLLNGKWVEDTNTEQPESQPGEGGNNEKI